MSDLLRMWADAVLTVAKGETPEDRRALLVEVTRVLVGVETLPVATIVDAVSSAPDVVAAYAPENVPTEPAKRRGRPPGSRTRKRKDEPPAVANGAGQPTLPMGAPST